MSHRVLVAAALLTWVADASAQRPAVPPPRSDTSVPYNERQDPRATGHIQAQIYIGQTAPDFELDDSDGSPVRLSRLRGDWILLVFMDRGRDLAQLRQVDDQIHRLGARLVTVTHEKSRVLKNIARRDSLAFRLLSDVTGQVAASYGMYDYQRSEVRTGFLMIDRGRVVRLLLVGPLPPPDALARLTEFSITGL